MEKHCQNFKSRSPHDGVAYIVFKNSQLFIYISTEISEE